MVSNELRWKGTGAVCVAGCAPPAGSGCQSDMGPVHGHTSGNRSVKGTKKRPNSAVHFKDRRGAVLWTLRTSEDLKNFQPHEQAVLIIHGNEMLPLHKDSAQFTLSR